MSAFPKKTPNEIVLLTFDFTSEVPAGSVLSVPTILCISVVKGTGATGDVTITNVSVAGLKVLCLIAAGLTDCSYRISAKCTVNNGEFRRIDKDLPVDEAKGALV